MATLHAASGELIDLRPTGKNEPDEGSRALVRDDHVEIFRLALPAGKKVPEHQVPSFVTIQCLEGAVEVRAHGRAQVMRAGTLIYLAGGQPHALKAIEDSVVLVTMLVARD